MVGMVAGVRCDGEYRLFVVRVGERALESQGHRVLFTTHKKRNFAPRLSGLKTSLRNPGSGWNTASLQVSEGPTDPVSRRLSVAPGLLCWESSGGPSRVAENSESAENEGIVRA